MSRLILAPLLVLAFSAAAAFAAEEPSSTNPSPFRPAVGQSLCYKRVYSPGHLAQHKGQKLDEIHMLLTREIHTYKQEDGSVTTSDWTIADVSGRSPQYGTTIYKNEFGCEFYQNGTARCMIECDGGSFVLKARNQAKEALMSVSKDYSWQLFREGFDQEKEDMDAPGARIEFEYKDEENRTYRLEQVPASECAWPKAARTIQAGC